MSVLTSTLGSGLTMDPRIEERRTTVAQQRRGRRISRALTIAMIVVLVAGAFALTRSPVLDVDEVAVRGLGGAAADEVREAAGIEVGAALVDTRVADARAAVAALPWVEDVAVRQSLSGVVEITVIERLAAAVLVTPSAIVEVDPEGRILAVRDPAAIGAYGSLMAIRGLEIDAVPGHWVDDETLELVHAATALPAEIVGASYGLEITASGLELHLGSRVGRVLLGDSRELEAKVWAIRSLAADADLRCLELADVRAPSVPVLTFRANCL